MTAESTIMTNDAPNILYVIWATFLPVTVIDISCDYFWAIILVAFGASFGVPLIHSGGQLALMEYNCRIDHMAEYLVETRFMR